MSKPAINWGELAKEVAGDRRRGKRLNLVYAIEISGTNRAGVRFSEKTKTQDISELGCRIETGSELEPGDVISIKLLHALGDSEPQLFEITWMVQDSDRRMVGARKLRDSQLWPVVFPPPKFFL